MIKHKSNRYPEYETYQTDMYNNFPYKRNAELCGFAQIGMKSGNLYKGVAAINPTPKKINSE